MKIKFTFWDQSQLDDLISLLKYQYQVVSVSPIYSNNRTPYKVVYIDLLS